jgi:sigma-B regulation protein RsbU (phosphoserine phosphatase)
MQAKGSKMSVASIPSAQGRKPSLGKARLHTVLVVPFILQIVIAVGLVGWLSFQNGQKAVNDLANQLLGEVSTRIHEHVLEYLEKSQQLLQVTDDMIQADLLDPDDFQALRRYYWQVLKERDLVDTFLAYANEEGEYLNIEIRPDGLREMKILTTETMPVRDFVWLDEEGNSLEVHTQDDNYDPRPRPWYQVAKERGAATWSPIFALFARQADLVIGSVRPVYKADGALDGILASFVLLTRVTDFLTNLTISPHGQSFIIERSGDLVASSTIPVPFSFTGEGEDRKAERLPAISSGNATVEATAQYILDHFGGFAAIQESQQLRFPIDNAWHYVQVKPVQDEWGLDLLAVVVVPEADFMGQINANTHTTIWLCLAALLVAIVVGILTARWVATPILRLNAAASEMAAGKLDQQVAETGVEEVGQLAHSFNRMAAQLKGLFESLEEKVRERTAQLASANEEISALNEQLKADNLRMGAELEVTRRLQQMILPARSELNAIEPLDIATYMEPAAEVGGDYYDVLRLNGAIKIGIGDVTDHGLESGVVMLMTQTAVRTLLNSGETDPVRFLDVLNRTVYDNVQRMQTDRTLTLALLDYTPGTIRLSGQHEELIVVRRDGGVENVDTGNLGFPIGLADDIADLINQTTVNLAPGDGIVLYTDGITEAENVTGEQYGLARLCASAQQHWDLPAEQIKDAIITDVRQHIGNHVVYDDITLVVVKQN